MQVLRPAASKPQAACASKSPSASLRSVPAFTNRQSLPPAARRLINRAVGFQAKGTSRHPRLVTHCGFGDKFKNFITGGAAKVSLKVNDPGKALEGPSVSRPFDVIIKVEASSDLDYNEVYLKIRNMEMLDFFPLSYNDIDERVTDTVILFSTEVQAAAGGVIKAGEVQEFRVQVVLPEELQPTFVGKYIKNAWEFEAAVGTGLQGGVNPSTGWQPVEVRQ